MECPICFKNLSHMTSDGREIHVNRCLDSLATKDLSSNVAGLQITREDDSREPMTNGTDSNSQEYSSTGDDDHTESQLIMEQLKESIRDGRDELKCPFCDKSGPQTLVHFKSCAQRKAPHLSPKVLLEK